MAQSLSGTWVTLLNMEVLDLLEEPLRMPLTGKDRKEVEAFDDRTMHPGIHCIPNTAPLMMAVPDIRSIEFDDGIAWIRGEFDGVERTVHLTRPADAKPSVQGVSAGRWLGDVFEITTDGFVDHRMGNGYGLPSGSGKKLVERLHLNSDKTSLTYEFTLEDPEYLAEPVSGKVLWAYRISSSPCARATRKTLGGLQAPERIRTG